MKNPFEIEHEATDFWEKEIEREIENIHFFNHEINRNEIIKDLYVIIDKYCKKVGFGIERIVGFANKKNGDEYHIADYEYACMFCYCIYTRINVVNKIKFIMDLFHTSRINVFTMLSGHLYMKHSDNKRYMDWYYEYYLEIEIEIELYFYNKYGRFIPYKNKNKSNQIIN